MRAACRSASSTVSTGPPLHGATGTPASSASRVRRDPVANQTHGRRVGPDEDDAEPLAQFGELGLLRDEAPPDPDRIGARLAQGALQRLVVDVAAVERDRLVGVADEHRVALGLGVERDDAYRLGAVDVELAHGVDDPHGGLAAVDDRKTGERALHRSAAHRRADRRERVETDRRRRRSGRAGRRGRLTARRRRLLRVCPRPQCDVLGRAARAQAPGSIEPRRDGRAHGP